MPKLDRAFLKARIEGLLAEAQLLIDRLSTSPFHAQVVCFAQSDGSNKSDSYIEAP